MKKIFSLLIVLLMLCSCSSNGTKREIFLFLPGEYINEDVVNAFEKEYKIKVNIDTFDSNESMYTKLLGGSVYDIVIPSDYMVERLIEAKMVQPLDKDIITNFDSLTDRVLNQGFDPDNTYSIPYFWGNVGIVYDKTMIDQADVESQGWEVLRNPKYKGITYMYDSSRDSFMIPLKQLGYSMNTSNLSEVEEAYNWLIKQNELMDLAYVTDEAIDGLAYCTDGKYMGVMYSGDAAYILSENENMKFFAPETGTNYWIDAMMIMKDAKNPEDANKFINYIISYEAQYENSLYVGYASVNEEALNDLASGEFEGNEAYIPRERNANDEVFHNNEEMRVVLSEKWIKVMNH